MALFDLNRAGDTPIASLKLAEIVPDVFPTLPAVAKSTDRANDAEAAIPHYSGGEVSTDWTQGNFGDDINAATASFPAVDGYWPTTQVQKAEGQGRALAFDVTYNYQYEDTTPDYRGDITPRDPYPTGTAGTTNPALGRDQLLNNAHTRNDLVISTDQIAQQNANLLAHGAVQGLQVAGGLTAQVGASSAPLDPVLTSITPDTIALPVIGDDPFIIVGTAFAAPCTILVDGQPFLTILNSATSIDLWLDESVGVGTHYITILQSGEIQPKRLTLTVTA